LSAIAGVYALDGRNIEPHEIEGMLAALSHRGSDWRKKWMSGSTALGSNLLWTTPESRLEKLPIQHRERGVVLTADARIDNRAELCSTLEIRDRLTEGITDSEIILAAYLAWGRDCPGHLLGDFSFAIWDESERILFCARDHFGIKPFYYYRSKTLFAFASEIKALFQLPSVPRDINDEYIAQYLTQTFTNDIATSFREIYRLPPAHHLTIRHGDFQVKRYWRLDTTKRIIHSSDDEYAAEFYDIFQESVHCRLRSGYSTGISLSGGLDSASILCAANILSENSQNTKYQTFSAVFANLPEDKKRKVDERVYIDTLLAKSNVDPHFISADELKPFLDPEILFQTTDEPYFAPNLFMFWGLYQSAQEQGMRLFLDGIDGDITVSHGLEYFPDLVRELRWGTLYKEAKQYSKRFTKGSNPYRVILKLGLFPLIPTVMANYIRAARGNDPRSTSILNLDLARRIEVLERKRLKNRLANHKITARERHRQELETPLLTIDLELLDKVSAAHSIETRHPFFDKRLVEYCLAIPPEQKLSQGWTRFVFRNAMVNILPENICWRTTKADFSINFMHTLGTSDKTFLKSSIDSYTEMIEPYMNISKLESTFQQFTSNQNFTMQDALVVYTAITLLGWLDWTIQN